MSPGVLLAWIASLAFMGLLANAAAVDLQRRKIPNRVVLGLLCVFPAYLLVGNDAPAWWSALGAGVLTFVASYILYALGVLGAGDSKLLSAAALFMGLEQLASFSFLTVVAGGIVALVMLGLRPQQAAVAVLSRGRIQVAATGVPYGVAIAAGAIGAKVASGGFLPV